MRFPKGAANVGWNILKTLSETCSQWVAGAQKKRLLYTKLVQSMRQCNSSSLFETLSKVLCSPIVNADNSLLEFSNTLGAIPSLIGMFEKKFGNVAAHRALNRVVSNIADLGPNYVSILVDNQAQDALVSALDVHMHADELEYEIYGTLFKLRDQKEGTWGCILQLV